MDVLTIILYVAVVSNMLKNPKTEWWQHYRNWWGYEDVSV